MLYREPKLLKVRPLTNFSANRDVSVLYREPKLLKVIEYCGLVFDSERVSVLYREPKLLKGIATSGLRRGM